MRVYAARFTPGELDWAGIDGGCHAGVFIGLTLGLAVVLTRAGLRLAATRCRTQARVEGTTASAWVLRALPAASGPVPRVLVARAGRISAAAAVALMRMTGIAGV